MRRVHLLLALAASFSACVSVEPLPDPRQAVAPKQRIIVLVYQSPGPWIIKESDSKAEAAAKILPVGFLVQTVQDDKTLEISKDLQQYLPRPRYDRELEEPLLKALKTLHSGPVQAWAEAGLAPTQFRDWNAAKDQLDWRRRYYAPEYGAPAPRDYSKILSLDDAVVLEVNLSFGTEAADEGRVQPSLSAALRLYRADTNRLVWSREETFTDKTSSMTFSEFKAQPGELTRMLEKLAPQLGETAARAAAKTLGLIPPTPTASTGSIPSGLPLGGLPYGMTPEEFARYGQSSSSGTAVSTGTVSLSSGTAVTGTTPVAVSTPTVILSTTTDAESPADAPPGGAVSPTIRRPRGRGPP